MKDANEDAFRECQHVPSVVTWPCAEVALRNCSLHSQFQPFLRYFCYSVLLPFYFTDQSQISTLLHLYGSLIRSKLDYGCMVYLHTEHTLGMGLNAVKYSCMGMSAIGSACKSYICLLEPVQNVKSPSWLHFQLSTALAVV